METTSQPSESVVDNRPKLSTLSVEDIITLCTDLIQSQMSSGRQNMAMSVNGVSRSGEACIAEILSYRSRDIAEVRQALAAPLSIVAIDDIDPAVPNGASSSNGVKPKLIRPVGPAAWKRG